MAHVKHLGFELELRVGKIVQALAWVPAAQRKDVVDALSPAGLRRAVADFFSLETK